MTNQIDSVLKKENGWSFSIPINPDNTDYQKYLAWLADGNTPQEADNGTN